MFSVKVTVGSTTFDWDVKLSWVSCTCVDGRESFHASQNLDVDHCHIALEEACDEPVVRRESCERTFDGQTAVCRSETGENGEEGFACTCSSTSSDGGANASDFVQVKSCEDALNDAC